jgi:hypothetical protein
LKTETEVEGQKMVKRNQLRYLWRQGDGVIQARDQVQKESVQGRTEEIKRKAKKRPET